MSFCRFALIAQILGAAGLAFTAIALAYPDWARLLFMFLAGVGAVSAKDTLQEYIRLRAFAKTNIHALPARSAEDKAQRQIHRQQAAVRNILFKAALFAGITFVALAIVLLRGDRIVHPYWLLFIGLFGAISLWIGRREHSE